MPRALANGIELEYETFGTGTPLLLVMGLGGQMVLWDDDFCRQLAARGFQVIRFDNRDVGLSQKMDELPTPRAQRALLRGLVGLPVDAPYSLSDMAADSVGLLDFLGLEAAHVVGMSMGGMIAQTMAIEHPARLRSLTSIMSNTSDRFAVYAKPSALRALTRPSPRDRQGAIERFLETARAIASPGFPLDEARVRRHAALSYDRCFYPRGFVRQLAAIMASRGRARSLRHVRASSLVLHGAQDPLVHPIGGRVTAWSIPGARLRIYEGMGHDLPEALWSRFIDEIVANTARAENRTERPAHGVTRGWGRRHGRRSTRYRTAPGHR